MAGRKRVSFINQCVRMSIVAIHQPQYLPYLGFFHKLNRCDVFIALDDVQFQKGGLQNRNKIKHQNGWQWITVPVAHSSDQLINEVQINTRLAWGRKHWQAIVTNYTPASHFDTYSDGLQEILEQDSSDLCSLNMALTAWVMQCLGLEQSVVLSSDLNVAGTATERLVNLCQAVEADTYLSGPGGRQYMELSLFDEAGITVQFQEFEPPVYEQLFPEAGFIPNLSVVDALFCCGPDTVQFL